MCLTNGVASRKSDLIANRNRDVGPVTRARHKMRLIGEDGDGLRISTQRLRVSDLRVDNRRPGSDEPTLPRALHRETPSSQDKTRIKRSREERSLVIPVTVCRDARHNASGIGVDDLQAQNANGRYLSTDAPIQFCNVHLERLHLFIYSLALSMTPPIF